MRAVVPRSDATRCRSPLNLPLLCGPTEDLPVRGLILCYVPHMGLFGDIPSWLGYAEDKKARKQAEARAAEQHRLQQEALLGQQRMQQEALLGQQRREEERDRREQAKQMNLERRDQASKIFATIEQRFDEDDSGRYTLGVRVHNKSDLPVYDLQVVAAFGVADAPYTTLRASCQPGDTFIAKKPPWNRGRFDFDFPTAVDADDPWFQPFAASARFQVFRIVFRDSAGRWWSWEQDGLREISAPAAPLTSVGQHGWKPKPKKRTPAAPAEPDDTDDTDDTDDPSVTGDDDADDDAASPGIPRNPFAAPGWDVSAPQTSAGPAVTPDSRWRVRDEEDATGAPAADTSDPGEPQEPEEPDTVPQDDELTAFDALKAWRTTRYKADGVKAYQVATNKTLEAIAETLPTTAEELRYVTGMGPAKTEKYGDEILAVVAHFS